MRPPSGGEKPLDPGGALVAHQAAQLAENLAAGRIRAEHQPGQPDHDQEQRRDGKQGVVRERRAHAGGVVLRPGLERFLEQRVDPPERRRQHSQPQQKTGRVRPD
jgi:hypothetical protein